MDPLDCPVMRRIRLHSKETLPRLAIETLADTDTVIHFSSTISKAIAFLDATEISSDTSHSIAGVSTTLTAAEFMQKQATNKTAHMIALKQTLTNKATASLPTHTQTKSHDSVQLLIIAEPSHNILAAHAKTIHGLTTRVDKNTSIREFV